MIDRRAAFTAATLIIGMFVAAMWSLGHVYAAHPEVVSLQWMFFGHLFGPILGIVTWFLTWRAMRKLPDPQNLEAPLKKHHGFILVSTCALVALIQALFVARDFGMRDIFQNMRNVPLALMGLVFVVIGNARGKLPSPYKGGHAEPFSWDKMNRFTGWIFVIFGFAMFVGAFVIPDRAKFASLTGIWVIVMSLLLLKKRRLKQEKRQEPP